MAWRAAAAIAGATTWRKARERPGRRGDADTDGKDAGDRAYCDKDAGVRGVWGDAAGVMSGEGVGDLEEGGGGGGADAAASATSEASSGFEEPAKSPSTIHGSRSNSSAGGRSAASFATHRATNALN